MKYGRTGRLTDKRCCIPCLSAHSLYLLSEVGQNMLACKCEGHTKLIAIERGSVT